jgi:signal transduction histidine kinase
MSTLLNWITKRHWLTIILATLLIWTWEALEALIPRMRNLFALEQLFYLALLALVGQALAFSSSRIDSQAKMMKIIDSKHKLSQELSICTDWDVLCDYLSRLPATFASVEQTHLFIANLITDQFEDTAQWNMTGQEMDDFDADGVCKNYLENFRVGTQFGQYEQSELSQFRVYCLPIQYGMNLLGLLIFRLQAGRTLSPEQFEIFDNIGDEISTAIKVGQERNVLDEMFSTKAALDERRTVSHYLHDHLAQNLGYVHFKLGQLISETDKLSPEKISGELERMREASRESYDIVRGTLEALNQQTTPLLSNLLIEYARKVAQRANFEIAFKTLGKPTPLEPNVQRAVFYVFQESLSNVERHASATKVDVHAEWADNHFELSIQDNGVGFNPQAVNKEHHFGLEIMRERLAKVKGRVKLTVAKNSGTLVKVWVPTPSTRQIRVTNG